jgi:hypothetical protein
MNYSKEIKKIKYLVDDYFNLNHDELDSRGKKGKLGTARIIYANLLMYELGLIPSQVPKHLKRDRSLCYYYMKQHDGYMSDARIYPDYYEAYTKICSQYYEMSDAVAREKHKNRTHQQLYQVEMHIEKLERERKYLIDTLC